MQKQTLHRTAALAALALLPVAGMAADSLKIYGRLDAGPLYQSNPKDGVNWKLEEVSSNRLGFIGVEDLSKDLKAFFRLEHRFNPDDGKERGGVRFWTDKAWVGLEHKTLGSISAGRVLTVGNSIVGGGDTEALSDSIGTINSRKGRIENNLDNGLYYESQYMKPVGDLRVRIKAHYGLTEIKTPDVSNPWGLGAQFRKGPFLWDIGYQHDVYRDGSAPALENRKSNSWFTGAGWEVGQYEFKSTIAHSKGYQGVVSNHSPYRMTTYSLSMNGHFGAWDLGVMGTKKQEKSTSGVIQPEINKFAVGYWYNFSKRTKFMPTIAFESLGGAAYKPGSNGYGLKKDKRNNVYVQIGFRHEF